MRLKAYLINEYRTKEITADQARQQLQKKCKNAVKAHLKGAAIFRGVSGLNQDFGFIEPAKSVRVSANTRNYYTLLLSESPHWKDYPRRDQSIICTTDRMSAMSYGDDATYSIFPYDGSRIGIVPEMDFWAGFENSFGIYSLDDVTAEMHNLMAWVGEASPGGAGPNTYKELRFALDKITVDEATDMYEEDYGDEVHSGGFDAVFADFISGSNNANFYEYLESKLDPKKNNFKVVKVGSPLSKGDHEVWTDGPSILIKAIHIWNPGDAPRAAVLPEYRINLYDLKQDTETMFKNYIGA